METINHHSGRQAQGLKWSLAFRTSVPKHRRRFKWRLARAKLATEDGPHRLRRSGATNDLRRKKRTLDQLQKRGRWTALESVNVYAKEHLWTAAQEKLDATVKERGAYLTENSEVLADIFIAIYEDGLSQGPNDADRTYRPATIGEVRRLHPPAGSESPNGGATSGE